jgi:hypothetical protein
MHNLKQIGLALSQYQRAHGRFPPAVVFGRDGRPLYSWRVLILPFLDEQGLYREFRLDEPWDSPHNRRLLARRPSVFAPVGRSDDDRTSTFWQAFRGAGTAFEGRDGEPLERPGGGSNFPDGLDRTILAVEAGRPVPWTQPMDLPFVALAQLPPLGGAFETSTRPFDRTAGLDFFHVLFGDGSVRMLKKTMPESTLRAMITRDGGEAIRDDTY